MLPDIAIARAASLRPIADVGGDLGIPPEALDPYGRHIAKLETAFLDGLRGRPKGRLVLVTAVSPTPAGEGKTTTTIGLGDGLRRIGRRVAVCLREPSLGPCFGQKGGATGGGRAQVAPMERINLHFTGDFHAITAAHNLLAAMLDNHIHWGNALEIDTRRVALRRALDVNDRALRLIVGSLGGPANGFPREDGFDITVASEVMAIFCLARDLADLEVRLARMIVAETRERAPVTASDLKAVGAMMVLLKDAFRPNLVQTLEGTPAFVHGGPFANIAHGCNSLAATNAALSLADIVVTEAGFGADLGAEKFFDIKCRIGGLTPDAAVIVATVRAMKMHGGVLRENLGREDLGAVTIGFANLARHIANLRQFGMDPLVAINHFSTDTPAEVEALKTLVADACGVDAFVCRHWAEGSDGIAPLAMAVADRLDRGKEPTFRTLYADELPLEAKLRMIARRLYGAADIALAPRAAQILAKLESGGSGHLPVCIAKTQYSFTTNPAARGAPKDHIFDIRDVKLSAGAGFIVAYCGDILTMPGLPRRPAAETMGLDPRGDIFGLS